MSVYSGRVRGRKANRRYGLQLAASNRADERLKMEKSRSRRRSSPRGLGAVSQPPVDEGTFFTRDRDRGLGATSDVQVIKPPSGLGKEAKAESGFAVARRERALIDHLKGKGVDAARVQLNRDGSMEILNSGGKSGVLNPEQVANIMKDFGPGAEKAAIRAEDLALKKSGQAITRKGQKLTARAQDIKEKGLDDGLGLSAKDMRTFTVLNSDVRNALSRVESLVFSGTDEELADAQADLDKINKRVEEWKVSKGIVEAPEPEPAVDPNQEKLDELQGIAENPKTPILERKAALRQWKKMKGIPPSPRELRQDAIRQAKQVVDDKDNQDPPDVVKAEAILKVAKKQADEEAEKIFTDEQEKPAVEEQVDETPPTPGAKKASDGNWYVKKDGKIFIWK